MRLKLSFFFQHIDRFVSETTNVHKHADEDHHHDTIDARLRAKHSLRQSVHQHTDDDKHENEEDCKDIFNSFCQHE